MTGPHPETESSETRPISVAELLAKNGTIGAPAVTRRRRRRRGDSDAVSVAELTGEIPVIRDVDHDQDRDELQPPPPASEATELGAEQPANGGAEHVAYWSEPEPRWPKSPPQAQQPSGPQLSAYPRPLSHTGSEPEHPDGRNGSAEAGVRRRGHESRSGRRLRGYPGRRHGLRGARGGSRDRGFRIRALLSAGFGSDFVSDSTLFGGQSLADELARRRGDEAAARLGPHRRHSGHEPEEAGEQAQPSPSRFEALWRGSLVVLQSILAVAFGAGLFVAFDQLWRWNSIVALVLSVLVILGLVVGVRVVRKTEDIASTLIAVAVGALITLGPLALSLQSG